MYINFNEKVVLVTGSTSGIGRQIAKQLVESGATVIIHYGHNDSMAEETIKELENYKDNILLIKADLADSQAVDKMFEEIALKYGRLDGLVNCAAYDKIFSIEDLTVEEYKHELNVDVVARFQCIKNAIPLMKNARFPRIINIASRLGTRPMEDSLAYCTSEAATIMMTKCAALELAKYNIKVNYIVWFDYSLLNWILRYYCVPTDYRINTLSPYYIKYFNKLQMQMYIIRKRCRGLF